MSLNIKQFIKFLFLLILLNAWSIALPSQTYSWNFPENIDPQSRYLFFLHGRIVEDSGLRPTSEEFRVPPQHITVAGASKGGAITVVVSSKLQNKDLNFVLIATCEDLFVDSVVDRKIFLTGRVLSLYDVGDVLMGSCQKYFQESLNSGLGEHKEIAIDMGNGHGFHYKPSPEWIEPLLDWALNNITEEFQ
ncbi:MAG: hypothetical protein MUP98_14800 [Candidatus Aminicenantes bacterium]|nr:hypothetical protein [Candidatus Aminicenantes bacterium]